MNLNNLGNMAEDQLFLGNQIVEVCQGVMDELEDLCLKLGTELTREEIIEIVKVRFNKKFDILKRENPPLPEERGE